MPPKKPIKPKAKKPNKSLPPGASLISNIILGTVTYKDFSAFKSYQELVRFLLDNEDTIRAFNMWIQEESYDREDEETGQKVEQFTIEIFTNAGDSILIIFDDGDDYDVDIRRDRP